MVAAEDTFRRRAPRQRGRVVAASRDPSTAQEVELRFVPEGSGTRLELTADKWETWGRNARRARRGYEIGWGYLLKVWAERRTALVPISRCDSAPAPRGIPIR